MNSVPTLLLLCCRFVVIVIKLYTQPITKSTALQVLEGKTQGRAEDFVQWRKCLAIIAKGDERTQIVEIDNKRMVLLWIKKS